MAEELGFFDLEEEAIEIGVRGDDGVFNPFENDVADDAKEANVTSVSATSDPEFAFRVAHEVHERDMEVLMYFDALKEFPYRIDGLPRDESARLVRFEQRDLFALMHRGVTWIAEDGRKVHICVPNMGVPVMMTDEVEKLNFTRTGFPGFAQRYIHTITQKINGTTFPLLRVSDGCCYGVDEYPLRIVRVEGYQGSHFERVGGTYYGYGYANLSVDGRRVRYVDVHKRRELAHTEGVVVHWDMHAGVIPDDPKVDLMYTRAGLVDAEARVVYFADKLTPALTAVLDGIEEGTTITISVSDLSFCGITKNHSTGKEVMRAQLAPNVPVRDYDIKSKNEWHLDEEKVVPGNVAYLTRVGGDYTRLCVPTGCEFGYIEREDVDKVILSFKTKAYDVAKPRSGYFHPHKFLKRIRELGGAPNYRCMMRYLADWGYYRDANVWRYKKVKRPVTMCQRVIRHWDVCSCDWLPDI